jgi:hypothetical protein
MPNTEDRKPNRALRIGGVQRCCIATLDDYTGPDVEGTVLPCTYCTSSLIMRDGAWEWNRPDRTAP